jgi:hypothetical protein
LFLPVAYIFLAGAFTAGLTAAFGDGEAAPFGAVVVAGGITGVPW